MADGYICGGRTQWEGGEGGFLAPRTVIISCAANCAYIHIVGRAVAQVGERVRMGADKHWQAGSDALTCGYDNHLPDGLVSVRSPVEIRTICRDVLNTHVNGHITGSHTDAEVVDGNRRVVSYRVIIPPDKHHLIVTGCRHSNNIVCVRFPLATLIQFCSAV